MILTWVAILSVIAAIISAVVADTQAREAKRQAESAPTGDAMNEVKISTHIYKPTDSIEQCVECGEDTEHKCFTCGKYFCPACFEKVHYPQKNP